MRTKRSVMLTGSALLTALALGPITTSPALAAPGSAGTTDAGMRASADITTTAIAKPKKKKTKSTSQQQQRTKGYNAGFADGRTDCKGKQPYSLQYTGSGAFQDGFTQGYNAGFHSCK
ncbi:hypothetical protein GCM10017673_56090 [Streptosporangium violaceochromogenes]|nr:hypothetical protein GCM10017673_56090 [Streptosporangium violaceochromogenes]